MIIHSLKQNNRYIPYKSIFTRYFKFLYVFFETVDDESMQRLFLIHCKQLVYILLCVKEPLQRLYIKKVCKLWSSGTPNVRIDAFIFLHELGKRMHGNNNDKSMKDLKLENRELSQLFKYMYQGYVTVCKRVSVSTMPGINFMINGMMEMYALNPVVTYKDAFKRLRSIAFHVKQAIQTMAQHQTTNQSTKEIRAKKLKQAKLETVQSVYNWRFINIIRLWAKVLGSHADRKNSDIPLLYYPFMQIACSVLTLSRSAMYDPARLKILQALCDLVEVCQKSTIMDRRIYAPLAPYLISIINNPAFSKKTKSQKNNKKKKNKNMIKERDHEKEWNIHYKIKIGDADFGTDYLHRSLMNNAVRLMILYFSYYSYSISFPEISFPTQVFLREFGANGNIPQELKANTKLLSQKLRENSNWITAKRKDVQFSPKDFEQVHAFLATERLREMSPLSKFIKSKQFEMMIESEEEEMGDNGNNNVNKKQNQNMNKKKTLSAEEKRVLQRKEKKQRKKQIRFQRRQKEKKEQEALRVEQNLLTKYKNDKKSNKVELSGLGDIVQDFELSDDE